MQRVGYWLSLAGLLAGYVTLSAITPVFDDEIYYWCWAQHLQPSYFDHPPMTALMMRASVALFGDSIVALRLPACITTVIILAILDHLTRPRRFLALAFLTPVFTYGGMLITPDTPLLLLWAAYLGWLVAVHRRLTPTEGPTATVPVWLWMLGGAFLGCGGLGKYTMILAVPAGFFTFLLSGVSLRRWLPGYLFHGVLAAAMATPVLLFNFDHDFAPLKFQWEHATAASKKTGLVPLAEFTAIQMMLVGVLPVVLLFWTWRNIRTLAADPRLRVCASMYAVPFTFFLYKATRGPLEGNWALACYLGFWPVAAHWASQWVTTPVRWRLTAGAFVVPLGCVAVATVHLIHPISVIPPIIDRVSRQNARMEIAAKAADLIRSTGEKLPVYCATYQWTALLRYYGVDARQIDGATRPSNFTLVPEHVTDVERSFVFNEGPLPMHMVPGYAFPEMLINYPVIVRGQNVGYVQLYRYTRNTTAPVLPTGHARMR